MQRFSWLLLLGVVLFSVSLFSGSACRGRQQEPQQPEYTPTATIKDLMVSIVDPAADVVWTSVVTVVSEKGIEEQVPQTDEDWLNVRGGAIRLAEAANLLMMPGRRVARPGEKSETPGVELEPEEIETNINKDRETWNRMAKALHDATLVALQAIERKDPEAIVDAGDGMEMACESCHSHYWYPDQPLPPGYGPSAP